MLSLSRLDGSLMGGDTCPGSLVKILLKFCRELFIFDERFSLNFLESLFSALILLLENTSLEFISGFTFFFTFSGVNIDAEGADADVAVEEEVDDEIVFEGSNDIAGLIVLTSRSQKLYRVALGSNLILEYKLKCGGISQRLLLTIGIILPLIFL